LTRFAAIDRLRDFAISVEPTCTRSLCAQQFFTFFFSRPEIVDLFAIGLQIHMVVDQSFSVCFAVD
jgi:hypothetical protein